MPKIEQLVVGRYNARTLSSGKLSHNVQSIQEGILATETTKLDALLHYIHIINSPNFVFVP